MTALIAMGALFFSTYQTSQALEATQAQIRLSEEGQLTDRFSRAVEQLSDNDSLGVRLGGIYSLERIARDSVRDHPAAMDVLSAFVRERAPLSTCTNTPQSAGPNGDVQTTLSVIGRRDSTRDRQPLDLADTCLTGINLAGANFARAVLTGANLTGANLTGANLTGAVLSRANLSSVDLTRANLSGAVLADADLHSAVLPGADLARTVLTRANLSGVDLTRADLSGAVLADANLIGATLTGAHVCDPNYAGVCVPIASDVACTDILGSSQGGHDPIRVVGEDIYGLDRDGDGIACEG